MTDNRDVEVDLTDEAKAPLRSVPLRLTPDFAEVTLMPDLNEVSIGPLLLDFATESDPLLLFFDSFDSLSPLLSDRIETSNIGGSRGCCFCDGFSGGDSWS